MSFAKSLSTAALTTCLFALGGCDILNEILIEEETPTKSRMEGVWEVVEAYNEDGDDITDQISFPVTAFHLSSDNTVISTGGPMIMQVVYGDNQYTQIAAQIDQAFNYASLDFTGGEFFVGGGVTDRFTLEMKLEGLPGQKALTELLDMIGIGNDFLDIVIYHKFRDIVVDFDEFDERVMYWEFDEQTTAEYNSKNEFGDLVSWDGWSVNNFSRSSFVLEKRSVDLEDLVEAAANQ